MTRNSRAGKGCKWNLADLYAGLPVGSHSEIPPARLESNQMLMAMKRIAKDASMGFTSQLAESKESFNLYLATVNAVMWEVYAQAKLVKLKQMPREQYILTRYQLPMDKGKSLRDHIPDYDRLDMQYKLLYYWANPWLWFNDVVGEDVMQKLMPPGQELVEFPKCMKEYLRDLMDPSVPFIILCCCRGGGKTMLNAMGATMAGYMIPKIKMTINSGSEVQASYMYRYYSTMHNDTHLAELIDGKILTTQANYKSGGFNRMMTASEKTARGIRPDITFLDEVCQMPDQLIYAIFGGSWTSPNMKVVLSSTPNAMNHMFHRTWMNYEELGYKRYKWTVYDTPWYSPEKIESMKRMYDSNMFRIEMLAEFGALGGTVFDHDTLYKAQLEPGKKYQVKPDEIVRFSLGIDWGYNHPTVVTVAGVDQLGHRYVWHVFGKSGILARDWYQIIKEQVVKWKPESVLGDSEAAFQNRELDQDLMDTEVGVQKIQFKKFKMKMIGELRRLLERGLIHFDLEVGQVKKLMDELFAYEYDTDSEGNSLEKPAKYNDDYVDSLLLAVWGLRDSAVLGEPRGLDMAPEDAGRMRDRNQHEPDVKIESIPFDNFPIY